MRGQRRSNFNRCLTGRVFSATLVLILVVICGFDSNPSYAAEESVERRFAAHALDLRTAGVSAEDRFLDVANLMPGSGIAGREVLPVLWGFSFPNMIVKLGRLRSTTPISMYYNPLLDIAVLVYWVQTEEGFRVVSARALPGEWLTDSNTEISLVPSWMTAENGVVGALVQTTTERLDSFGQMHPTDSTELEYDATTFASAALSMRAILPRLIWNAQQRTDWNNASHQWLEPTLSRVEEILAENDPWQLVLTAPETDAVTAEALADLPVGYLEELALDMVFGSAEEKILVGSSIYDGDTYVMVSCMLQSDNCDLHQFLLISLIE